MPRFVAAEVSGSLVTALGVRRRDAADAHPQHGDHRDLHRREPGHRAVAGSAAQEQRRGGRGGDNDALVQWVAKLAKAEGIWAEPSSVAPLVAIEHLRAATALLAQASACVALLTASGLKDTGPIETALPEAPVVGDRFHRDDARAARTHTVSAHD